MSIGDERAEISARLAPLLEASAKEVEAAITLVYERRPPEKRNLISVLATAEHFWALLFSLSAEKRRGVLAEEASGMARRDRALNGELDRVAVAICDDIAGPYDVAWDGNWPSARPRPPGKIPEGAEPGDIIVGGDGGGTRIDIAVLEDDDGTMSGEAVPDTWRDPPLEDVWLSTYRRLKHLYPQEEPRLPGQSDPGHEHQRT